MSATTEMEETTTSTTTTMPNPPSTATSTTTSTKIENRESKVAAVSSQDTEYVSEDEQLQDLEKSGAINCVVGSQSLLSQEIGGLLQDDSIVASASHFHPQALLSQDQPDPAPVSSSSTTTTNNAMKKQSSSEFLEFTEKDSQEFLAFAKAARSKANGSKAKKSLSTADSSSVATTASADSQKSAAKSKKDSKKKSRSSFGGAAAVKDFGTLLSAVEIFTSQEEDQEVSKLDILSQEAMRNDPILDDDSNILANHAGDQESQ
jgi:hypothetical protein